MKQQAWSFVSSFSVIAAQAQHKVDPDASKGEDKIAEQRALSHKGGQWPDGLRYRQDGHG
jgi:hypothetical protein